MRGELSTVVGIRLRAYTGLYQYTLAHEPSLAPPVMLSLGGLLVSVLVLTLDDQIGAIAFLRDAFLGDVDWLGRSAEVNVAILGVLVAVAGLLLYVAAGISVSQILRERDWRDVMRAASSGILGQEVNDAGEGSENPETELPVSDERPVAH